MPKLNRRTTFTVRPLLPFHFDGTFHKPSNFPNKLALEEWQPGKYWQTFRFGNKLYGLKIEGRGRANRPKLRVSVYSNRKLPPAEIGKLKTEISWRFELDRDLSAFNTMARKDKRFFPVFRKWLGMRNTSKNTLYELLIIAIVLQNATVRRSQQMLDALISRFGTKVEFAGKTLWSIWLPERLENVSEQTLRDLKIGYRAKFIKKLSHDFASGTVDEYKLRTADKETAKTELMKLYGIGPESARILLFETYHHFDVFDHIAPWQQKIYSRLFYNKPRVSVKKIQTDIKRRYGTFSMLAVHYIWEDIFWRRRHEHITWLEREIRL